MNEPVFSNRTSVHVHVNLLDSTIPEIKAFVLLYLCFERLLYAVAGGDRDKSIFCVPLTHAGYVSRLSQVFAVPDEDVMELMHVIKHWHKYTGFNLLCLSQKGTAEFRHLPGTLNVKTISNWIALITCIKDISKTQEYTVWLKEITALNTNSQYDGFIQKVFGEHAITFFKISNFSNLMEKDISHIKECFIPNENIKIDDTKFPDSLFDILIWNKAFLNMRNIFFH